MTNWQRERDNLQGDVRVYMDYLLATLPFSDLDAYPFGLLLEFVEHAAMLRRTAPWCAALEEQVFLDYVLYPRVNDEDLSAHRALFYRELYPRVQGLTQLEAVLEANRWAHEIATYQAQDDRTASPLTVYRNASGRCGEESTFVVAALRSVGIAARQVYAPRWSHCNDNHAWVEALCDGVWRFFGACEPEPVPDKGWFNAAAARAVLVHSRRFDPQGGAGSATDGEPVGRAGVLVHHNQTGRYAPTKRYTFRVLRDGVPAAGAPVRVQILNDAKLTTVARLETDGEGRCSAALGIGDIHLLAGRDGAFAEGICRGAAEDGLTLELSGAFPFAGEWMDFDFHAPPAPGGAGPILTPEQKARRGAVMDEGRALREARLADCYHGQRAAALPGAGDILRLARGNFDEIAAFLERDGNPLRLRLLRALRPKDLRDSTAETLEDHLAGAALFAGQFPADIYDRYLLSPRIADEGITAWRGPLAKAVAGLADGLRSPKALWGYLCDRIRLEEERVHPTLYWPPEAALAGKRCDGRSRKVLFVAMLRAMGIPARLRPMDGAPEYWRDGGFVPAVEEGCGAVTFCKEQGQRMRYGKNWGLSRWSGEGWTPMALGDDGWEGDRYQVELPTGSYRLLTTVRLPGGDQFASSRCFAVEGQGACTLPLRLRGYRISDLLTPRALPAFEAEALGGGMVSNADLGGGRCALLFWLEEGAEPTEHILNELAESAAELQGMPVDICFLLRSRDSLSQATLAGLLSRWPGIRVGIGEWEYTLENMARQLYCDPERPPLSIVCDGEGRAVYATTGYNVSAIQLMIQILRQVQGTPGTAGGDS